MDLFFTYLKQHKEYKTIDFLDKEINDLNYLISLESESKKYSNKVFRDYSKSLFIVSDEDDVDAIMLN
jgi:hypothetical protein|tara:strand:+ start:609 stop:812 length:204 start_codon:yes stop_codon:yes gene_type:complete